MWILYSISVATVYRMMAVAEPTKRNRSVFVQDSSSTSGKIRQQSVDVVVDARWRAKDSYTVERLVENTFLSIDDQELHTVVPIGFNAPIQPCTYRSLQSVALVLLSPGTKGGASGSSG